MSRGYGPLLLAVEAVTVALAVTDLTEASVEL